MTYQKRSTRSGSSPAASLSRRRFLQSVGVSAGMVIAWSSAPIAVRNQVSAAASQQEADRTPPTDVDSYLTVNEDGTVTLGTGKVEYGQGIRTGFAQLVAEELDVAFGQVNVVMGITDEVPYDIGTFGSLSTRMTGPIIRKAAAEMRQWLLERGSDQLGVSADQLTTKDGAVIAADDSDVSVSYADLASGETTLREMNDDTPLKDPATYTVVGQDIPRVDVPQKVTGEMIYPYDATVDGMVHGKIVRPPALGAKLLDIDFHEAEKMPGVVGTFREGDFAGLATETRQQAQEALMAVKATWSEVNTGNTSENIYDLITSTADEGQILGDEPGDPDSTFADAETVVSATFRAPYVSHSPLEPKASVVKITPERVDVWTANQVPFGVQEAVAKLLDRPLEQVVVTTLMAGGAFGSKKPHKGSELEAAQLAQAFGRPVKLQWDRQEEFQFGDFRPAEQSEVTAALDAEGNIVGWKHDLYSSGYFPEDADEPSSCLAEAGADATAIYDLPNAKITWYQGQSPLPVLHWRGNGNSHNVMAHECIIDELAEQAGLNPVAFRTKLLANNPRLQAVMDAVVEKSGWAPGVGSTGQGFGIAVAFADGTYVAEVAQVKVDAETGQIDVEHIDVAVDCGLVVNPLAATLQTEGAVIFSLSPTLREAITFANGKITNASWGQYKPIRMDEVPSIDVVFVEDKTQPMGGMGEPGCAPVPGAIANAVYDAIGVRLRELPFTPARVLAAIEAQAAGTPEVNLAATPSS